MILRGKTWKISLRIEGEKMERERKRMKTESKEKGNGKVVREWHKL